MKLFISLLLATLGLASADVSHLLIRQQQQHIGYDYPMPSQPFPLGPSNDVEVETVQQYLPPSRDEVVQTPTFPSQIPEFKPKPPSFSVPPSFSQPPLLSRPPSSSQPPLATQPPAAALPPPANDVPEVPGYQETYIPPANDEIIIEQQGGYIPPEPPAPANDEIIDIPNDTYLPQPQPANDEPAGNLGPDGYKYNKPFIAFKF